MENFFDIAKTQVFPQRNHLIFFVEKMSTQNQVKRDIKNDLAEIENDVKEEKIDFEKLNIK